MNKPTAQINLYTKFVLYTDIVVYTIMVSLVIFGVSGYALSQYFINPSVQIWSFILIISFITALIYTLYSNKDYDLKGAFSLRNFVLGLIPYLVLVPGFTVLSLSTRVQLSRHGAFHMGYVFQILHGFSPPENVVLPGFPANTYWLYNALLAVLVNMFNASAPFMSAVLNISALICSFYWIRKSISLLGLNNKSTFITSCYTILLLFGLNLFGSLNTVLHYVISGSLGNGGGSLSNFIDSSTLKSMVLGGDPRLINLINKYLNFNGMPLGVLYFCFAIYLSLLILKKGLTTKKILLLATAISGALMFHTTSGLFVLLIIPLSLLISLLYTRRQVLIEFTSNTNAIEWLVLLIVCFILFIPVLHYVYSAARAIPAETHIGRHIRYNLISIPLTVYPIIPLSIFAVYQKYRQKTDIITFFGIVSAAGYILTILIDLPGRNQYKYVFLSTIAFCFLSIIGLDYMYCCLRGGYRKAGRFLLYIIIIILGSNILLVGFLYHKLPLYKDKTYYVEDRHVFLRNGTKNKGIYEWIRENANLDTVVIMPYPTKNTGNPKSNKNGNIYIIGERLPYTVSGSIYAIGIPEHKKRKKNIDLFYSDSTPIEKRVEILGEFEKYSKKRPSILLIPKVNLESISPYLDKLELIYSGQDANLYRFDKN